MSALSSSSTLQEIIDSYMDNASFFEDSSATKALAFVTACSLLLMLRPKRARHGEEEIELNLALIQKQKQDAQEYIAANGADGTGGGILRQVDLRDFRE